MVQVQTLMRRAETCQTWRYQMRKLTASSKKRECYWDQAVFCFASKRFGRVKENHEKRLSAWSSASVCPSVLTEQLGTHSSPFQQILYFFFFQKSVAKIQVLLKSEEKIVSFTCRHMYKCDNNSNSSQNEKCFRWKCITRILKPLIFFSEYRAVKKKNMVQPAWPFLTI